MDLDEEKRLSEGPHDPPYSATEDQHHACHKKFVYRVCRKGETPWSLRQPPASILSMGEDAIRALMLQAVATGNQKDSCFLHSTSSLKKVILLSQERRHLYCNWLVRWPRKSTGAKVADFDEAVDRHKWLSESQDDSRMLQEWLRTCRSYVLKDSEQVWMQHPGTDNVEWWDQKNRMWKTLKERPLMSVKKEAISSTAKSQSTASASCSSVASSSSAAPVPEVPPPDPRIQKIVPPPPKALAKQGGLLQSRVVGERSNSNI